MSNSCSTRGSIEGDCLAENPEWDDASREASIKPISDPSNSGKRRTLVPSFPKYLQHRLPFEFHEIEVTAIGEHLSWPSPFTNLHHMVGGFLNVSIVVGLDPFNVLQLTRGYVSYQRFQLGILQHCDSGCDCGVRVYTQTRSWNVSDGSQSQTGVIG